MSTRSDQRRPHRLRAEHCGQWHGWLATVNGQDTVRCAACDTHLYNAPRHETGREPRRRRTREDITTGTRLRVLERDGWACIVCHRSDVPLDVGHLLSVAEAVEQGLGPEHYNDPGNLAAVCTACNSGQGRISAPPWLIPALLRARSQRQASA